MDAYIDSINNTERTYTAISTIKQTIYHISFIPMREQMPKKRQNSTSYIIILHHAAQRVNTPKNKNAILKKTRNAIVPGLSFCPALSGLRIVLGLFLLFAKERFADLYRGVDGVDNAFDILFDAFEGA